jgi:hypothetical protein
MSERFNGAITTTEKMMMTLIGKIWEVKVECYLTAFKMPFA